MPRMAITEFGLRFGLALRTARREQGWSQERLARDIGYSLKSIQHWESGRHIPETEAFLALVAVLGMRPFGHLIGGTPTGIRWYRQTPTEQAISSPPLSRTRPDASVSAVVAA